MNILDIPYNEIDDDLIDEYYDALEAEYEDVIDMAYSEYKDKLITTDVLDRVFDYLDNETNVHNAIYKAIDKEALAYRERQREVEAILKEQAALNYWIERGSWI